MWNQTHHPNLKILRRSAFSNAKHETITSCICTSLLSTWNCSWTKDRENHRDEFMWLPGKICNCLNVDNIIFLSMFAGQCKEAAWHCVTLTQSSKLAAWAEVWVVGVFFASGSLFFFFFPIDLGKVLCNFPVTLIMQLSMAAALDDIKDATLIRWQAALACEGHGEGTRQCQGQMAL